LKFDYRAAKYDIVLTDETVAVMPAKGRNIKYIESTLVKEVPGIARSRLPN